MTINVLIRGQSNALVFADKGAWAMEQALEKALGQNVNILADWGDDTSTIYSGTAFMAWDSDGEQAGLLQYLRELPPEVKANPTITIWMHNEYDQGDYSLTKADWLREVRADAALVRAELGQGADTTPYLFVPIKYPYGNNWSPIGDGMDELSSDRAFNASISWDAQGLAMDGDGFPGSSHMGAADATWLGQRLAGVLTPIAQGIQGGTSEPPQVPQPAPAPATPPAAESGPTPAPQPNPESNMADTAWVESFDGADPNNILGKMNRWWGNPDWWSVPGQVTLTGKAGEWADSGVMVPPVGPDAGNGYGTWEIDFNSYGTTIGDYILLWSSADVWPHGEYDILEFDFGGYPYSAIHYAGPNDENFYDSNYYKTPLADPYGDHTVSMTWAEDDQGRPFVSVTLDGVVQYTQYDNIDKDFANGGPDNRSVGFGQQFFWNLDAQSGDNKLTVYEVRYTPWNGKAAAPSTPQPPVVDAPAEQPPVVETPPASPAPSKAPVEYVSGTGPDTLVLQVAQDYFQADARYSVSVDGKEIGVFTASALNGSGQYDTLTVRGDWGQGDHMVSVTHLNDAWVAGEGDSNIYVPTATYNGKAIQALGGDWWGGEFGFTDTGAAQPPATQPTPPATQPTPPATEPAPPVTGPAPAVQMPEVTHMGTSGKDVLRVGGGFDGAVVRGGLGADKVVLGNHDDATVIFTPGEVRGDVIRGFKAGDTLAFYGFGEGATLEAGSNGRYIVTAADGSTETFRLPGFEVTEADYIFA